MIISDFQYTHEALEAPYLSDIWDTRMNSCTDKFPSKLKVIYSCTDDKTGVFKLINILYAKK